MNITKNPVPLYSRILDWSSDYDDRCCGESRSFCPDCGHIVCVFCEDACEVCETSVF